MTASIFASQQPEFRGEGGGGVTPAPSFSVLPSISPSSGDVGDTFTGSDGTISNGTVTARAWLLDGVVIEGETGTTITPDTAGELVYRVTATGAGGETTEDSSAVTVAEVIVDPTGLSYGRTADYDAGTIATIYVATDGNDTTGTGSLAAPYATLQKAHDVATAGNVIAVRAGTYREKLAQTKALTIKGYGTEVPVISGGYVVTGWTVCDSGDESIVGSNYASIYKATVSSSIFDAALDYYHCILLTEGDTVLDLVQRRADTSNLWEQTVANTAYQTADGVSFATDGSGYITTITHAAVLGGYTDTQLAETYVYIHATPNTPIVEKVASSSSNVLTLPAGSNITPQSGTQTYALLNILPAMAQGQWGFVDNGATVDFYVWPNNTANLTSGMSVATKTNILSIASTAAGSVYRNLQFEHCADSADTTEAMIELAAGADQIDMQQCVLRRYSHQDRGAGSLMATNVDDFIFRYNDVEDGQNQYGIFLQGTELGSGGSGARVEYNRFTRLSQSACRRYKQFSSAYRFNYHDAVGAGDHANKLNASISGDITLDQGNIWLPNCGGYITVQTTSRMLLLNNIAPTNYDGRSFDDQNYDGFPTPTDPSNNYIIGNLFPLAPTATVAGSFTAIMADKSPGSTVDPNWGIYNNVTNGITVGTGQLIAREGNVLTLGSAVGTGEETAELVELYYDAEAGIWTTFPNSLVRTKSGVDVSAIIEEWEAYYPDLDLRLDILGEAWDPALPGVGPYVKGTWTIQSDVPDPVLTGLSSDIAGTTATCSVTTDTIGGTIYWVRLADGATTPTAAQIAAGQDSTGAAAPDSGSTAVGGTAGEKSFSVSGTVGTTYKLAVTQEDRYSNLAAPVTTSLVYPASFSPVWVAFNGTNYLRNPSSVTGAQATTQTFLIAVTHKRSAGQNAVTTNGITNTLPSTRSMGLSYTTNHRLHAIFERAAADNTVILNQLIATQDAPDVEFLTLYRGYNDGSVLRMQERVIKIADGTIISVADQTTPLTNFLTWASTTQFHIFQGAGTYERFMLWDNATADITGSSGQDLFYDSVAHTLKDPAVAAAAIGTPLISIYGNNLSTGTNSGSGGNWTWS